MSYATWLRAVTALKADVRRGPVTPVRPAPRLVEPGAELPPPPPPSEPDVLCPPPPQPHPVVGTYRSRGSVTVAVKHLVRQGAGLPPAPAFERPRTRGDCLLGSRPCPFVGCRYNTYLEVTEAGSIVFNHPGKEPDQVDPELSCCLDVGDAGAREGEAPIMERVGEALGLTRQRVDQIESSALAHIATVLGDHQ